ncbi:hypothetical protein CAPTEDRAFT_177145 [Capitella teleta]|uniref:glutathione transferase n=1 Tax=Capitella teleta TaxID=283909 RepID=R7UPT7_CAPTE|nr:hypothetical protein CAPTEDRAFT_177145 [Capitella teleta]|eukprot:ELU08529.1 hypothetical protein CAPTEDRAFT_177145 [Capitella teleta]
MPTYKLMYFNARGLAEAARWLFALAGQPYEDYRFKEGEWDTFKAKTPCGQAPVLVVDGKEIAQSKAIFRYLAKQFGFVGETDLDQARGDMIVDYLDDLRTPLLAVHHEQDETKKKELMDKFKENVPNFLNNLEKLLKENNGGDGFFVGDKLTWTDVAFACNSAILKFFLGAEFLDAYPKLKALIERVESQPAIAEWIQRRPVTNM